jgi:predicted DNA-binding protein
LASADHECEQKYDLDIDISPYKVYTIITKVYKGILMTVKVEKSEYKKELFSLPMDVVETLKKYAEETHKKKSHIVADAISEYIAQNEKEKYVEDALSLIGIISEDTPDIQEIKANREDI